MTKLNEDWKVFGPNGMYRISNLGRIQTLTSSAGRGGAVLGETWKNKKTYYAVSDKFGGKYVKTGITIGKRKYKTEYLHRLVVENFIGEIPKGMQVNHIDGDRNNNSLDNLEIVSPKANIKNAIERGKTFLTHERTFKFDEFQALTIHTLLGAGRTQIEVGESYGVNRRLIAKVANGGNTGYRSISKSINE